MTVDDASSLERRHFAAGDRVFSQGEAGTCAFVLLSGEIELFQNQDGHRIEISRIHPGGIFGEMAVLDGGGRSANAVALSACEVALMPVSLFRQKLDDSDAFVRGLIHLFVHNIGQSPKLFLRRPRSVRDHVRQMATFGWHLRRFAGRMHDTTMADDLLDVLDRLDDVLRDLGNVAELIPDKRHDLVADTELNGVGFSQVIGTEGRRKV